MEKFGEALAQLPVRVQPQVEFFFEKIGQAAIAVRPYLEAIVRLSRIVDAIQSTGWLPHRSITVRDLEPYVENVNLLEQYISRYYEENWDDIRCDIVSHLETYSIDKVTKEAFKEALSAHDNGHYRCVCRVLFPEIEKTIRIKFTDGSVGHSISKKTIDSTINTANIKYLILDNPLNLLLFMKMARHLYRHVDDSNLSEIEIDDSPNRHAALHGLVDYSDKKNSINMIVMADYMFQFLSAINVVSDEDERICSAASEPSGCDAPERAVQAHHVGGLSPFQRQAGE